MDVVVQRFDVFLVTLDPTVGSEIQKTRPCVIVSPDEINSTIRTVIVAPLTSTIRPYPTRLACRFQAQARSGCTRPDPGGGQNSAGATLGQY